MATNREIVESERFKAERDDITDDAPRWDEMMRAVMWALSKSPGKGKPTDDPDILALPTVDWDGAPPLVFYYRFNDDLIELLSVQRGTVDSEG